MRDRIERDIRPAVHWKRGKQIEGRQDQIAEHDAIGGIGVEGLAERQQADEFILGIQDAENDSRDEQVYQRPRDGDPKLLARFGGTLQPGDAADRVQHDFRSSNSIPGSDQRMPELVQQHRNNHREDKQRVIHRGLIAAQAGDDQEDQQQDKSEMQANGNAPYTDGPDGAGSRGHRGGALLFQTNLCNNCGTRNPARDPTQTLRARFLRAIPRISAGVLLTICSSCEGARPGHFATPATGSASPKG